MQNTTIEVERQNTVHVQICGVCGVNSMWCVRCGFDVVSTVWILCGAFDVGLIWRVRCRLIWRVRCGSRLSPIDVERNNLFLSASNVSSIVGFFSFFPACIFSTPVRVSACGSYIVFTMWTLSPFTHAEEEVFTRLYDSLSACLQCDSYMNSTLWFVSTMVNLSTLTDAAEELFTRLYDSMSACLQCDSYMISTLCFVTTMCTLSTCTPAQECVTRTPFG